MKMILIGNGFDLSAFAKDFSTIDLREFIAEYFHSKVDEFDSYDKLTDEQKLLKIFGGELNKDTIKLFNDYIWEKIRYLITGFKDSFHGETSRRGLSQDKNQVILNKIAETKKELTADKRNSVKWDENEIDWEYLLGDIKTDGKIDIDTFAKNKYEWVAEKLKHLKMLLENDVIVTTNYTINHHLYFFTNVFNMFLNSQIFKTPGSYSVSRQILGAHIEVPLFNTDELLYDKTLLGDDLIKLLEDLKDIHRLITTKEHRLFYVNRIDLEQFKSVNMMDGVTTTRPKSEIISDEPEKRLEKIYKDHIKSIMSEFNVSDEIEVFGYNPQNDKKFFDDLIADIPKVTYYNYSKDTTTTKFIKENYESVDKIDVVDFEDFEDFLDKKVA